MPGHSAFLLAGYFLSGVCLLLSAQAVLSEGTIP